ncbi:MAG: superoxide dismutase [Candidatus Shapirobacteria bacterium]|jgi:Fe-Mn family superoxide dismutase
MKHLTLPPLPYDYDALEPVISQKIMELHHDKHHAAYVAGANLAMDKMEKARNGEGEINYREVMRDFSFNFNGALLHEIFWRAMRPVNQNTGPSKATRKTLEDNFGSVESMVKEFNGAALNVEGSGWAVLWKNKEGELSVGQLEKHNLFGLSGMEPILVIDVWEHAYYLDYLNDRKGYIQNWWQVVNWDEVEKSLQKR